MCGNTECLEARLWVTFIFKTINGLWKYRYVDMWKGKCTWTLSLQVRLWYIYTITQLHSYGLCETLLITNLFHKLIWEYILKAGKIVCYS